MITEADLAMAQNRFWDLYGTDIHPGWLVYFLGDRSLQNLKNVVGDNVISKQPYDRAWSFFVDMFPDANFTHECAYICMDMFSEDRIWNAAEWPPDDDIEMKLMTRP